MTAVHSPLRRAALAALRTERVRMKYVRADSGLTVVEVIAQVLSSREGGPRYAVDLRAGAWHCTCREGLRGVVCKHVHAVQLVTTGAVA